MINYLEGRGYQLILSLLWGKRCTRQISNLSLRGVWWEESQFSSLMGQRVHLRVISLERLHNEVSACLQKPSSSEKSDDELVMNWHVLCRLGVFVYLQIRSSTVRMKILL